MTNIIFDETNNAFILRNKAGGDCVCIDADPKNGGSGMESGIRRENPTIKIDGDTGDISLLNADCAENFEVSATEHVAKQALSWLLTMQANLNKANSHTTSVLRGLFLVLEISSPA